MFHVMLYGIHIHICVCVYVYMYMCYMDGWVDGWMDGWLLGKVEGWIYRRIEAEGWMNRSIVI